MTWLSMNASSNENQEYLPSCILRDRHHWIHPLLPSSKEEILQQKILFLLQHDPPTNTISFLLGFAYQVGKDWLKQKQKMNSFTRARSLSILKRFASKEEIDAVHSFDKVEYVHFYSRSYRLLLMYLTISQHFSAGLSFSSSGSSIVFLWYTQ